MSNEHEALKPCPFCGAGEAQIRNDGDPKYPWSVVSVHHYECFLMHSNVNRHRSYETEAEAIAAWNARATPSPSTDTRRDALNRMVELDEEIEASNPGWMTGGPVRYRAIAAELTEALAKRDTDMFRAIAFKERHHIIAALGGSHD